MKAAIVILLFCSLGLGIALLVRHNNAVKVEKENQTHVVEIGTLSNKLEETRTKLDDQERVAIKLEQDLGQRKQELHSTSNNLVQIAAELSRTRKEAEAAAEAAKAEMAKRDARINELEGQKAALDKQATDLESAIDKLKGSIVDTEKKLLASEGDREFLLKELKRLQKEKADLERQFNDLAALRTQVSKLKEELSVARRLEWIRMGIYGFQEQKGASRLMAGTPAPAKTNFNLNVELKQDGSAKVLPRQTNSAANPK